MGSYTVCPRRGKVTLVAFVWLFSTVSFHVYFQMVCLRGCKVTLVASVWLFSTLCFQMSPQIACLWECKVTLFAFVWLFSTVYFQMSPQIVCPGGSKVTLAAFVWLDDGIVYVSQRDFHIGTVFPKSLFHIATFKSWMCFAQGLFQTEDTNLGLQIIFG